jgi:hypothetical protein
MSLIAAVTATLGALLVAASRRCSFSPHSTSGNSAPKSPKSLAAILQGQSVTQESENHGEAASAPLGLRLEEMAHGCVKAGTELPEVRPVKCSVEGCNQPVLARGWCRKHYLLWYRPRSPLTDRRPRERVCSVEECGVGQGARFVQDALRALAKAWRPDDRLAPKVRRAQLLNRGLRAAGHGKGVVYQALQPLAQAWRPADYPPRTWAHLLCRRLRATGRRQGMVH